LQTALDLEFVPRRAAIRAARDATSVIASLLPDRADDLRLLVSEVVTNSIVHRSGDGRDGWLRLRLLRGDGRVRVEVSNPGSEFSFERTAKPGSLRESGWGMYLLESLADRWGVSSDNGCTCVWFELAS
jgi:anti-sigma regulatory factor (Ser/Thr protein kinase)